MSVTKIKNLKQAFGYLQEKGITVVEQKCYDPGSGWHGMNKYLKDELKTF